MRSFFSTANRRFERWDSGATPGFRGGVLLAALALASAVFGLVPASILAQQGAAGASSSESGIVGAAQRMAARQQQIVKDVQTMVTQAEADRAAGRLAEAYVGYATALKSTPSVPATAELRRTIFSRYQAGAMEYARKLADGGQVADAETVLKRVLADARDLNLDASAIRADFRTLLGELNDPEIYSPARTPRHIANVAAVSKTLIDAQGAINLGDLDKAHDLYIKVLNVDRYNEAAARGLELVNRMMTEYEKTAHDHTRSRFIREVEQQWEAPVPIGLDLGGLGGDTTALVESTGGMSLQQKLNRMMIPSIQFDRAPLRDVLAFLSQRTAQLDTAEPDPSKRGVNVVIDPSAAGGEDLGAREVTIKLSSVPLADVLRYVTGQARLKYRVDQFAVTVVPLSASDDNALVTQRFVVPPGFITGDGGGGDGGGAVDDPFANPAPAGSGTTLVRRVTAEEFLTQRGIKFPAGATATYIASTNSLVVRNTPDALSLIDSMVLNSKSQGAKQVEVDFRLISIGQVNLAEMGFDYLVSPFNINTGSVYGSGGTTGNQVPRVATDYPFPVGTGRPVTAGLRSGDVKTQLNIDDVLVRNTADPPSTIAPGVFGVSNIFGSPQFQGVWRALDQSKGLDRLCETKVLVKPGQTASVRAVREFIYPTEYDPPEVPQNTGSTSTIVIPPIGPPIVVNSGPGFAVTPAHPTAFEMRELGKIMEVQPLVSDDNLTVNLSISVDMTEFIGFVNYGVPITAGAAAIPVTPNRILQPVFEVVRETTNVTVWDGQTVVMGGFIGDSTTDVEDKLPLLGDLPGIGRLFRSSVEDTNVRAILLFVSVRLVDPGGANLNNLSSASAE